ncbi:MAG: phenylacetic acid degradation protein PaaN [Rhodocyclales bacterium]|nr:phenylacetic acid degradation protein PaaN [Rhodocyclales bacterium]
MSHPFFEKHRLQLDSAVAAIQGRGYWAAYPESARAYGEPAMEAGRRAFAAYRNAAFHLDQPGVVGRAGGEISPFGLPLNIGYPKCDPAVLVAAAKAAMPAWAKAGADARAGVCLEILERINARSFEIAHAIQHTTGQAYMMAFQAAGPHAQDRGVEAVAYAWREMKLVPETALWEKPQGKNPPLRLEKTFRIAPRGVALVIACSTFPTWNGYPGLFASLATGNAVIVKPHPTVILPLAISVAIARETLKEAGFDPNLVCLAVDEPQAPVAQELALHPDVRIVDFTGSPAFGDWLERNARQAVVFTEKAGVNCVVVDSTDNYPGMLANLAFTLALYSGQMCTAPQALFVPAGGVATPEGAKSAQQFGRDLAAALDQCLARPERAVEILGAIQSPATAARIEASRELGEVLRESAPLAHPQFPEARIRTPLLLKVPASAEAAYAEERFGPISFVVETAATAESLALAERIVRDKGALTLSVYSSAEAVLAQAEELALRVGVALSCNLTGGVYVNQSAGFSDFHATGANPAANACLTDAAFVASRFFVVQSRRHL